MNFRLSEQSKNNIKFRFNELHGIYTKTLSDDNKVLSYIARCDCPNNNQYVVVVHYQCKDIKTDKYLAMANCITKGQRFLKMLKKNNFSLSNEKQIVCLNETSVDFDNNVLPKIKQYQRSFIDRIKKYYKEDKKILMFYI